MDDDSLPDTEHASVGRLLKEILRGATISIWSRGFNGLGRLGIAYSITVFVAPAAYGVVSVLLQTLLFLRAFMSGAHTAITRTLPRYDIPERNYLVSLFLIGTTAFAVLVGAAVHVFREAIAAATLFTAEQAPLLSLFSITFVLFTVLVGNEAVLRTERRVLVSNLIDRSGRPITQLVVVLVSIFAFGAATAYDVFAAITVALAILLVISTVLLVRVSNYDPRAIRQSRAVIDDYVSFIIRSIPNGILVSFQAFSYSLFVALLLSSVEAAIFGVAFAIGGIIRWPLSSVNHIFPPIASGLYDADRTETINDLYADTTQLIMIVSGGFCTAAVIYAPTVLTIFSDAYASGALALRLIAIGQFVAASFGTVGLLLLMTDNERPTLKLQFILTSISIPMFWTLTSTFGLNGLAAALALILLFNNVSELILLKRREGLQPFRRAHIRILSVYVLLGLVLGGLGAVLPMTTHLPIGVVLILGTMWGLAQYAVTDRVQDAIRPYLSVVG